jgi:hypothetical protein
MVAQTSTSGVPTLGFSDSVDLPELWRRTKVLVHFHDHHRACSEQIGFQVLEAGVSDALADLGPDFFRGTACIPRSASNTGETRC